MLTVLVSTIYNSQVRLLKKIEKLLQMQKLLTFFSTKIFAYMPYLFKDQRFNDTLTIDIVSFEQLGPDQYMYYDEQGKSIVLAG